jgi:ABC-type transport system involved in multi-copper enzyme maturation permease subunit
MLWATFVMEREPTRWADLGPKLVEWLQGAGAVASLGLAFFFFLHARSSFDRMFGGPPRLHLTLADRLGQILVGCALLWLGVIGIPVLAVLLGVPLLTLFVTFCVIQASRNRDDVGRRPAATTSAGLRAIAIALTLLSWFGFAILSCISILATMGVRRINRLLEGGPGSPSIAELIFAASGACAFLVVVFPVLQTVLFQARLRRIGAVARLAIKEARNGWVLPALSSIALIFLFGGWFIPFKPEDQVRNYVSVLHLAMTILFILCAAILGSFGLPNDIKKQTIHTIVTKPITKFEIVLGRFVGHGALLTVALFVMAGLSLIYIYRGVNDQARAESLKARVATYGQLRFHGTKDEMHGQSVGREWHYRSYIGGQLPGIPGPKQYAIWQFDDVSNVGPQSEGMARVEFTFDIFRLTKGTENRGVNCSFYFATGDLSAPAIERIANQVQQQVDAQVAALQKKDPSMDGAQRQAAALAAWKELGPAEGVYRRQAVEITDYQTQFVEIPFEVLKQFREKPTKGHVMQVLVSLESDRASAAQMLGVARHDLYFLANEGNFYLNFLKGVVGLWCSVMLVLGVAVALSTYLSGVITLIAVLFLYLAGMYTPDIVQLAENRSFGGGPTEALVRIVSTKPIAAPLDDSPSTSVVKAVDEVFRWWFRRLLNLLPDIDRYDLHPYVANGFDIPLVEVLLIDNILALFAYLVPWALLAYYLIQFREIANPT